MRGRRGVVSDCDYRYGACVMTMSPWAAAVALCFTITLALRAGAGEDKREIKWQGAHNYTYCVQTALPPGRNPYHGGYLRLECIVEGPRGKTFSVEWRHRSILGKVTKVKGINLVAADGEELASSRHAIGFPTDAYARFVRARSFSSGKLVAVPRQAPPLTSTEATAQPAGSDPLKGPLYAILAVVAVFCAVIVVLTISVVVLCHRKCKVFTINGGSEHRVTSCEVRPPPQPNRPTAGTRREQIPVHVAAEVAPPPQKSNNAAMPDEPDVSDYSKLAEWTGNVTMLVAPPSSSPGQCNIYSTMDKCPDGCNRTDHHYCYHMLEQERGEDCLASCVSNLGNYERHPNYVPKPLLPALKDPQGATPPVPPQRRQSLRHAHVVTSRERSPDTPDPRYQGDYERDPHYVPPLHTAKEPSPSDEDKYQGDYERDPHYVPPLHTAKEPSPSDEDKYQGDYERDPHYVPPLHTAKEPSPSDEDKYQGDYERDPHYVPPLHTAKEPSPSDEDKYQGDYERDPHYVPPHSLGMIMQPPDCYPKYEGDPEHLCDPKYGGDYERDPEYLRNKLIHSPQVVGPLLHHHPYAQTNTFNEDEPLPPSYPHHGYKALDSTLRDPLRHYTQLSIDQMTSSPSPSGSELT